VVLRKAIDGIPELKDRLAEAFANVPAVPGAPVQPQGLLFYALSATPKITFLLGQADSTSAATLPIVLDFPVLDLGGFGTTTPGTAGIPGTRRSRACPRSPWPAEGWAASRAPVTAGTGGSADLPVLATSSRSRPEGFGGLPLLVLLSGLFLAGAGARGLLALQAAALAGGRSARAAGSVRPATCQTCGARHEPWVPTSRGPVSPPSPGPGSAAGCRTWTS
jgi:hypothetical protein